MEYDALYPHKTSYTVIAENDVFLLLAGGCEEEDCYIYTCVDWVVYDLASRGYQMADKPIYFIDCSEGTVEITQRNGEYLSYSFCDVSQTDFLHKIALQHPEYRAHVECTN